MPKDSKKIAKLKIFTHDGKIVAGTLQFKTLEGATDELGNTISAAIEYSNTTEKISFSLDANGMYNLETIGDAQKEIKKISAKDLQTFLNCKIQTNSEYELEAKKTKLRSYDNFGVIPEENPKKEKSLDIKKFEDLFQKTIEKLTKEEALKIIQEQQEKTKKEPKTENPPEVKGKSYSYRWV